ncbi:unnamed protein product, partial [Thlaspi arvense]
KIWIVFKRASSISHLFSDKQSITCEVSLENGIYFIYYAIYASNELEERNKFLPWLVNGDFNKILSPLESSNPDLINSTEAMREFEFSDHTPCHIKFLTPPPAFGTRPFKFYNFVAKLPSFIHRIREVWDSSGLVASSLKDLGFKLKSLKKTIKSLCKEKFSSLEQRVQIAMSSLKQLQLVALNNLIPLNVERVQFARDQWMFLRLAEESFFRQRSHIKWMEEGDLDTRYFHLVMTVRNSSNSINYLRKTDGSKTSSLQEVHLLAQWYYDGIFSTVRGEYNPYLHLYLHILIQILCSHAQTLRNKALLFLQVIVRNGEDTFFFFWWDPWTPSGQLIHYLGPEDLRNLGIPLFSSYTMLVGISHQLDLNGNYFTVWEIGEKACTFFSSKDIWDSIRQRKPEVSWLSLIWHKAMIPKHAITGLYVKTVCLLCGQGDESRNHLFFDCAYSKEIWLGLLHKLHFTMLPNATPSMDISLALLQLWQGCIYEIWKERNPCYHNGVTLLLISSFTGFSRCFTGFSRW